MKQQIFLIIIGLLLSAGAYAQSCTQKLNTAEDDYAAGRLLKIPKSLEACLDDGSFSKEEEVRAKKLLTLVYIFTDNEKEAEEALVDLLKAEPEYVLDAQVDPAELFFLYNQFRVEPIFRVGLKLGTNFTRVNVIQDYSTGNVLDNNLKFYNGNEPKNGLPVTYEVEAIPSARLLGWSVELTAERYIGKGLEIALGGQFRSSSYNVTSYLNNVAIVTTLTNRQNYLRVPVMVRYNLFYEKKKALITYLLLGASPEFLVSSRYIDSSRGGGTSYTLPDTDTDFYDLKKSALTDEFNYSIFGGLGLKIRAKTHFLTIEARYDNARLNYTNGANRYTANPKVLFDQAFVEDDISLDHVSITVGYTRSLYKPQKIK